MENALKVYVYAPGDRYSFGATVVAANSTKEAKILVKDNAFVEGKFIKTLDGVTATGEPRILYDCSDEA